MRKTTYVTAFLSSPERAQYLSILSNTFFGYAFGRMLMTPQAELPGNVFIKLQLIVGVCLFVHYSLLVRGHMRGILRTPGGRLRPAIKEMLLLGTLSALMMALSLSTFFLRLN